MVDVKWQMLNGKCPDISVSLCLGGEKMPVSYETTDHLRGVPICENGEPLVDFTAAGLNFSPQHPVFPYPRVHLLREGVVQRLLDAVKRLPRGWTLYLEEGFRPIEVQRLQHEANKRRFLAMYPHIEGEELRSLLEDFSAPVDVPEVPPPHSTGGALDVHMLDGDGVEVDLISPYTMDHITEVAAWDAPVSEHARRNREILKAALEGAGITNYPGEFWHWSYGDQGWAHRGGHPCAVYGRLDYNLEAAERLQGKPADRSQPRRSWPVALPEEVST